MDTVYLKHPLDDLIPNHFWPDKKADVSAALNIVAKHADPRHGFSFIESINENGDNLTVTLPKWILELFTFFTPLYGADAEEIVSQLMFILTGSSDSDISGEFKLTKTYERLKSLEATV